MQNVQTYCLRTAESILGNVVKSSKNLINTNWYWIDNKSDKLGNIKTLTGQWKLVMDIYLRKSRKMKISFGCMISANGAAISVHPLFLTRKQLKGKIYIVVKIISITWNHLTSKQWFKDRDPAASAGCGRKWDNKRHFTAASKGLIVKSSPRGLRDGVHRFGGHANTPSQDECGCWRGEGGGADEEERAWGLLTVITLCLWSRSLPVIILKILSWALKVQRNKSELLFCVTAETLKNRSSIFADYWRKPAALKQPV